MAKKIIKLIDNKDGTISDPSTGLMWAKEGSSERLDFKGTQKYCKNSSLANYKDWRLPTIKELISIIDYDKYNPAINSIFKCESNWYWSSTSFAAGSGYGWVVGFYGGVRHYGRDGYGYVRPVRQYSKI